MKHTIKLQKLGKRKLKEIEVKISGSISTLSHLLEACVTQEVKRFNDKIDEQKLISFLTPKMIQERSDAGKIGFGHLENKSKAILAESIDIVLQAYIDGVLLVFIDDQEIEQLDSEIDLSKNPKITFLRLTFLTGTYW